MYKRYAALVCILIFFFVFHLINLTLLPIFNDEAIYIDWGLSAVQIPSHQFDSLLDAKQPLMVWMFGIFASVFPDPLFGGRAAGIVAGSLTVVGLYFVAKKLFNKQTAVIATLLYSVVPIFVFYHRQALMESAIACIGIWSFYFLLLFLEKPNKKTGSILGLVWGVGFLIKSSIALFFIPSLFLLCYQFYKKRERKLAISSLFLIGAFFCTTYIVFIQPYFWQSLKTNSRYTFTIVELLHFPITSWLTHFLGFLEISFVFMTPVVFLISLFGLFKMKKENVKYIRRFIIYFIGALFLESFLGKTQNQRYLMPFLTFLIISAAYVLNKWWKGNFIRKSIVILTFSLPILMSGFQIFSPAEYIVQLSKLTKYSDLVYVEGQTSGYGIKESAGFIKAYADSSKPNMVFFALNAGNPENAIDIYTKLDSRLYGMYIDAEIFPEIEKYQCMSSKYPVFFVTRSEQQASLNRFFELEKSFPNPDGEYFVGIYTIKKNCVGETLPLSDFYQPVIDKMSTFK